MDKPETFIAFAEDRLSHDIRYSLDSSKIRSELGCNPRYLFNGCEAKKELAWKVNVVCTRNVADLSKQ